VGTVGLEQRGHQDAAADLRFTQRQVPAFARPKAGRTPAVARGEVDSDQQVLRGIGDLVVE
jgi:hypothetical protein